MLRLEQQAFINKLQKILLAFEQSECDILGQDSHGMKQTTRLDKTPKPIERVPNGGSHDYMYNYLLEPKTPTINSGLLAAYLLDLKARECKTADQFKKLYMEIDLQFDLGLEEKSLGRIASVLSTLLKEHPQKQAPRP